MNQENLSRRGFIARSLAGMTAAGLPLWYAKETLGYQQDAAAQKTPATPNGRLVMGAIGTGTNRFKNQNMQPTRGERGIAIMQDAMRQQGVQMVAVCDVDRVNADYSANIVRTAAQGGSRECAVFSDFRELLARRDIDAVTIGTPDHWHAIIAIAALKAGKHVYCEKPLTLTLEEGRTLVRVARETGKTLQTGSQQRSDANFRLACELVRNGRIGRVRKVTTLIGTNPVGGPFPVEQVPEGLNWDFWQGPTPNVEFVRNRCHYEFRWWYEYSGGKMTDWGAHHNDIAQWGLGMDDSGPTSVYAGRCTPPSNQPNSYNCHPTFEAIYTYANGANGAAGTQLVCRDGPPEGWPVRINNAVASNGVLFEGEDGKWIFVNRGNIRGSEPTLISEALPQNAMRLEVSTNHMGNFMDCVRSRRAPICNVNVGHRSVSICHLGNIAIRLNRSQDRPLRWNPQEERFVGDDQANAMLSRPYRAPWRLEA
jgi:predicted dehydrogenase